MSASTSGESRTDHLLRIAAQRIVEEHVTAWRNAAIAAAAAGLTSDDPKRALLHELRYLHMTDADILATRIAIRLREEGLILGTSRSS
jgi:hypothetical protein